MEAAELLREQLDDARYQLEMATEGMSEDQMDHRLSPTSMTPREQIAHLCEAYQALITLFEGGKHQWGAYDAGDRTTGPLKAHAWDLRGRAIEAAFAKGDRDALKHAHDYVLAHDYYHVGQVCAVRVALDPAWDPYSIYNYTVT